MPNKNYLSGRRKEYKVMKELRMLGRIVLRTAGSHGFADLISIDTRDMEIEFIQCKPDSMSEKEKNRIEDDNKNIKGEYWVTFKVI